jgi:LysM repeat protein
VKKASLLKLVVVGAALVALQLALVSTSMAAPPAKGDAWGGGGTCYTVQAGDTLSDIAYKFNVATFYLAQVNNLRNPDWIFEGQQLCIPAGGPPFWHPAPVMHPCQPYTACPPMYPQPMPPIYHPMPPHPTPYYGMGEQGEMMPYNDPMMGQGQYDMPYDDSMMGQGQYMPYSGMDMGQQVAPYAQMPPQTGQTYQNPNFYQ